MRSDKTPGTYYDLHSFVWEFVLRRVYWLWVVTRINSPIWVDFYSYHPLVAVSIVLGRLTYLVSPSHTHITLWTWRQLNPKIVALTAKFTVCGKHFIFYWHTLTPTSTGRDDSKCIITFPKRAYAWDEYRETSYFLYRDLYFWKLTGSMYTHYMPLMYMFKADAAQL